MGDANDGVVAAGAGVVVCAGVLGFVRAPAAPEACACAGVGFGAVPRGGLGPPPPGLGPTFVFWTIADCQKVGMVNKLQSCWVGVIWGFLTSLEAK